MICAGMGQPPFMRFTQYGVDIYLEQETPMVGDVVNKFIAGDCARMVLENACSHNH